MNATDYTRWRAQIPQLSADQREQTKLLLKQLEGRKPLSDDDWLLTALLTELRRRGLVMQASKYQVKKLAPGWPDASAQVRALLLAGSSQPLSLPQQLQLGALAVSAYLDRLLAPPTLGNTLRLIKWLPVLFDRAYPDYLANKLVLILLTARIPVDNPDDLE
jgi:hypothetical protein